MRQTRAGQRLDRAAPSRARWTAPLRSPWICLLLLLVIVTVDAYRASVTVGLVGDALTDETAHVCTALLALLAAVRPELLERRGTVLAAALVASVAIDLDHLPLYAGVPGFAEAGRPGSHSLTTVVLLLAAAALTRRARAAVAGSAVGVALHLLRDLATGPGVPLLWPWTTSHVLVPYQAYLVVVAGLAVVAVLRRLRPHPET